MEKKYQQMAQNKYLVEVKGLSKKFCRRLKRSLWYGIRDIGSELIGSKKNHPKLRKEEFWALRNINFKIKKGELVGLIGPNGAGKTTILKVLSGLVKPDEGEIIIHGKIQALISLGAGFNPILSGRENVYINGAILGFSKKELDGLLEEILDFSEIGEFIDMPVQSYSSGMKVRLGFAIAVNLKPDILIVDEVLAVGDASFRRKARNKMMELLHSGISVLFVSHNMGLISSLTSRCFYLQKGKMIASGPSDTVVTQYMHDSLIWAKQRLGAEVNDIMASASFTLPDVFLVHATKLLDSAGNDKEEFNCTEVLNLVVDTEFLQAFEKVTFAVTIMTETDGIVITSTKFTPEFGVSKGPMKLHCSINESRLREGIYNVGFYVLDYKGGTLFKSNLLKSFAIMANLEIIKNSDTMFGLISVDATWRIL